MRQYSLFIDSDPNLSGALMVREPGGAVRPAQRKEILAVARELVSVDELRNNDLSDPAKVRNFLRLRLAGLEHEVCGMILLDNRMHLITYLEPFRGTINQAQAYPREVLKLVLRYNAAAVMLVHNHPSGEDEASAADIRPELALDVATHQPAADDSLDLLDDEDEPALAMEPDRRLQRTARLAALDPDDGIAL